jgi:hypothetical protein
VETMRQNLAACTATNEDGSVSLNVKLPSADALTEMATALARLLA